MQLKVSRPVLPLHPALLLLLASWLGASALLDFLVMPVLYAGGMMTQSGFASTGYQLFEAFNHVELVLGAGVLAGLMTLIQRADEQEGHIEEKSHWRVLWPALLLFAIPLFYAYGLTPVMAALGLALTPEAVPDPTAMGTMHLSYWGLELLKLSAIALLIYRLGNIFGLSERFSLPFAKPE